MATNLVIPTDIQSRTADQKADFYSQQRMAGFSDPAIRNAVSGAVGPQSDADWNYLLQLSGYNNVAPDSLYRSPSSGNSLIAALRGNTPQPPAGSVSSFSMLPNRESAPMPAAAPRPEQPFLLNRIAPFGGMPQAAAGSARPVSTPINGGKATAPAATPAPAPAVKPVTAPNVVSDADKTAFLKDIWTTGRTGVEVRSDFENLYGPLSEDQWRQYVIAVRPDLVKGREANDNTTIVQPVSRETEDVLPRDPTRQPEIVMPVSRETDDISFLDLMNTALPGDETQTLVTTPEDRQTIGQPAQPETQQQTSIVANQGAATPQTQELMQNIDDQLLQEMMLADLGYISETAPNVRRMVFF